MKKMKLSMLFAIATAVGLNFSVALAQDCTLPVCDIPAKIEELRAMTQNSRSEYLKELLKSQKGVKDPVVLANLDVFAAQVYVLFHEINEEDWMVREVNDISNFANSSLLMYNAMNMDLATMIAKFDAFSDPSFNYKVMNYWVTAIEQVEDTVQVKKMMTFAEHEMQWSNDTKQEDYFAREAKKGIDAAGVLLSRLLPVHEGAYKIKVSCKPSPSSCNSEDMSIDQINVLETLGSRGLVISVLNSNSGLQRFYYINSFLTNGGTQINAQMTEANPWARLTEIDLTIKADGGLKGAIKDLSSGGTIIIEGKPIEKPVKYFTDAGAPRPLTADDIVGVYNGTLGKIKGTLLIKQFVAGQLVGSFVSGSIRRDFQYVNFKAKQGVIVFGNSGTGTQNDVKLTLALRKDRNGKEFLTGFLLTSNGTVPAATFYKVK